MLKYIIFIDCNKVIVFNYEMQNQLNLNSIEKIQVNSYLGPDSGRVSDRKINEFR